jgi:hypothetical protein
MSLIVNVRQVTSSGTLTNTAEFIVNGSVTEANPSFVSSQIWNGNAAEMSAYSGNGHNRGVSSIRDLELRFFVELSSLGKCPGLSDLRNGKTTHKNELTVPRSLDNFTWGEVTDIDFLVGITDVAITGEHLVVNASEDGFNTQDVRADNESLEHVTLGTFDIVVTVLFVPKSKQINELLLNYRNYLPVLIEPVVYLGLHIKWIAKVTGAG